jgi:O-antigen/teichoic acid export membrane protein
LAALATLAILLVRPQKMDLLVLVVGIWLAPLLALLYLYKELIRGTQHIFMALAPPMVLQYVLTITVAFILFKTTRTLSSGNALVIVILALFATLAVQVGALRRALPRDLAQFPSGYEIPLWLRTSFPLLLVSSLGILMSQVDVLVIGAYLGPKEAGIYSIASKTATLVNLSLIVANAAAAPQIAMLHARGDRVSLQRMISTMGQWMFWPSLGMTLFLILFGQPVLRLFGSEFTVGYWSLGLLAFGQLINVSAGAVLNLMNLTGHQAQSLRVYAWVACTNLILNLVLIPRWGIAGAALSTTLSVIGLNVWLAVLVEKHLGIRSFVFENIWRSAIWNRTKKSK